MNPRKVPPLLLLATLQACVTTVPPVSDDLDGDGWSVSQGDCDDGDPERHPNAEESCNRIDDDCDGTTDESSDIVPLPPGVYGLEQAHATIRGAVDDLYGFGGWLYNAGDLSGDSSDDLAVTTYAGLRVFEAAFCPGPIPSSASSAFIQPGGNSRQTSSALGDADSDGIADIRVRNRLHLSPLPSGSSETTLNVPGFVTSMKAADLDGDGTSDLVVGDTTTGTVRFHRGPLSDGTLSPPVTVSGDLFGAALATLPALDPPLTVVGRISTVSVIEGLPTADREGADWDLETAALFAPGTDLIGTSLASDGHDRLCVGTDFYRPSRVVCGTIGELVAEAPELVFLPRAGSIDDGIGPHMSMTRDLVAVGHYGAPVSSAAPSAGVVYVKGEAGDWEFEWDGAQNITAFGRGVALLRDPIHQVTWLAAAAKDEEPGGVIYLYALDVAPTM